MKYLRKTAHLRLAPFRQIPLPLNKLRCGIRFRTPRKIKESKNLLKWDESSYPKARFLEQKLVCNAILPGVHNSVANRTENRFASLS